MPGNKKQNQPKYITKEVFSKKIGEYTHISKKLTKPDNKRITAEDLRGMYNNVMIGVEKKYRGKNPKILVRAMNANRVMTLKGYNDDDINLLSTEEYLAGRVQNNKDPKFSEFYTLVFDLKFDT